MEKSRNMALISKYRANFWRVPGWFPLVDFEFLLNINGVQQITGVRGDILEIGTYKGKSGILLSLCAEKSETVRLLDLYTDIRLTKNIESIDYKSLNDGLTRKNLNKYGSKYELVFGNSLEIPSLIPTEPHRIIHIDGSHQYEIVRRDLENALNLLSRRGVIVLDDYRNVDYPGVSRAFWEFYESNDLEIICATPSRIYMTQKEFTEMYLMAIKKLSHLQISQSLGGADMNVFDLITFKGRKKLIQKIHSFMSLLVLFMCRIPKILIPNK